MSISTIEVDSETLANLNGRRRGNEPLDHTIRRLLSHSGADLPESAGRRVEEFQALMDRLAADPLSDEAIEAVEQVIVQRERPINKLDHWNDDAEQG